MPILELGLFAMLGVFAAVWLHNVTQQRQQLRQLEEAFYQLLEEQDSCVSLIQLAATARVDAQLTQQYLKRQAQLFDGVLEVDADGAMFYRFPKLRLQTNSDK